MIGSLKTMIEEQLTTSLTWIHRSNSEAFVCSFESVSIHEADYHYQRPVSSQASRYADEYEPWLNKKIRNKFSSSVTPSRRPGSAMLSLKRSWMVSCFCNAFAPLILQILLPPQSCIQANFLVDIPLTDLCLPKDCTDLWPDWYWFSVV